MKSKDTVTRDLIVLYAIAAVLVCFTLIGFRAQPAIKICTGVGFSNAGMTVRCVIWDALTGEDL